MPLSIGFKLKLIAQQARVLHARAQTRAALLARTGDIEHGTIGDALLQQRDKCIDEWFDLIEQERTSVAWPTWTVKAK